MSIVPLKPVDRVEILSVMDNSIDVLMGNTPVAKRHKRERDSLARPQLRAEHGVSMLVTTYDGGNKDSFLFDTGVTVDGVLHNMDVLEIKGNELHAVVLSHGHTDHTRGLMGFIKRYGRPRVPIGCTLTPISSARTFSPTATNPSIFRRARRTSRPKMCRLSRSASRRC